MVRVGVKSVLDSMSPFNMNKKLSYRRGTARCVVSVEIWPIATQHAETTCRTIDAN